MYNKNRQNELTTTKNQIKKRGLKMGKDVCIVHMIERDEKGWQIMKRTRSGFNHVFPGVLFTLDEARDACRKHGFNVIATGDMWQCLED